MNALRESDKRAKGGPVHGLDGLCRDAGTGNQTVDDDRIAEKSLAERISMRLSADGVVGEREHSARVAPSFSELQITLEAAPPNSWWPFNFRRGSVTIPFEDRTSERHEHGDCDIEWAIRYMAVANSVGAPARPERDRAHELLGEKASTTWCQSSGSTRVEASGGEPDSATVLPDSQLRENERAVERQEREARRHPRRRRLGNDAPKPPTEQERISAERWKKARGNAEKADRDAKNTIPYADRPAAYMGLNEQEWIRMRGTLPGVLPVGSMSVFDRMWDDYLQDPAGNDCRAE